MVSLASSMTVIVPAWEVTRLLDQDSLVAQRTARDSRPDRIAEFMKYKDQAGIHRSFGSGEWFIFHHNRTEPSEDLW